MVLNEEISGKIEQLGLNEEVATPLFEAFNQILQEQAEKHAAEIAAKDKEIAESAEKLATIMEQADAYAEYVKNEVTDKVGAYAEYAINEFISENKEHFTKLEKFERMQAVFEEVKAAFENNGFPLNENAGVDSLISEMKAMRSEYDELFESFTQMSDELDAAKRTILFMEATRDLTDVQIEKVRELSESVTFANMEEYAQGLSLLIGKVTLQESAEKGPESKEVLTEGKTIDPRVQRYLSLMK